MKAVRTLTPVVLGRIRALSERVLGADEVRAALAVPISGTEEEEARSLIRWFRRRYATPGERLAYARRAYKRWAAARAGAEAEAKRRH
jgi:hypothetical protein